MIPELTPAPNSVMVLVPHPDDELLLCAGVLCHAVKSGLPVTVVICTNGDYDCTDEETGSARLRESLAGLRLLGVDSRDVIFLGYADTGMPEADSFLTGLYREQEENRLHPGHVSGQTYGLPEHPDYHSQRHGRPAAYTRRSFLGDLGGVISEKRAAALFTTAPGDTHGDHSALYRFVTDVLVSLGEEGGYTPALYSGMVHSPQGDDHWPEQAMKILPLTAPTGLESTSLCNRAPIFIPMPAPMRVQGHENLKHQAIRCHKTALKPDAREYLLSFVKTNELFWRMR